jgi:hypothetical protein
MPGVTFFEEEAGRYAYMENGSNTYHSVDNKQMSIMLKNGHPVLSKLTCSVYEVPANLLDPNPGEMSSAGTRWNAQGPRQTYQNPKALDLAMAGYWKEAEIWEAGHGCAGCHIERPTNGPVPNEMLDLNQYNRVALMMKVASDVVGAVYDPRNPMTMLHMGISHTMNSPIASGKSQETRPADPKVFPGLSEQEVGTALDNAKGGTGFELPASNPKTGEGLVGTKQTFNADPAARIAHADEMQFRGVQGAKGKPVEVRRHSADRLAPADTHAHSNPVTVVNTTKVNPNGTPKTNPAGHAYPDRYLDPSGNFVKPKGDVKDAVHYK